jgi:glycine cleavage system H lipoate-binding protein
MRCPFLQETNVRFCQASPFRKMIVQSSEPSSAERCSSPHYAECPAARQEGGQPVAAQRCPFLQVSLMQYCSAASVTKYIPYSESLLSRCGSENYRYCEFYVGLAEPEVDSRQTCARPDGKEGPAQEQLVDGVRVSTKLAYTSNHMWIDENEDGSCHVGVDAFFTRVLGKVDKLSFATPKGAGRPSAVISACGVDLPVIFPRPIEVTRTNDYLRATPEKLISHPYSLGWLFEGRAGAGERCAKSEWNPALIRGRAILDWMRSEVERISRFVHQRCAAADAAGEALMMDGGTVRPGLAQHLDREEILVLFNDFFAL